MSKRLVSLPQEANIDLDERLFNPVYRPHLMSVYNYEIYYGGSGSGKSFFIGEKLAVQMTLMAGRNLVCLRKQKTDCIDSCWAEIKNSLTEFNLLPYWEVKENPDHVMINRLNGNEIRFEGLDNIEDIKSIKFTKKVGTKGGDNLTDVWYEEANAEPTRDAIDELQRRLRDRHIKCRIIISFNPVSRNHWLFDFVTRELPNNPVYDSLILKTTYKDNLFLPAEYGAGLEHTKYTNPYDYQVYALGNWGTMGTSVFDVNGIQRRLDALSSCVFKQGDFYYTKNDKKVPDKDSYKFYPNSDGDTVIFREPENRVPYVLAIDTAGEGSDFWGVQVCNNITGEQVARFHGGGKNREGKITKNVDECVWQIYGLARMYNDALVCPEVNFDTWVVKAFLLMGYDNLYRRQTKADERRERLEDKYGWRTGSDTRQMMLSDMVYWTNENMDMINDVETLNEMITFTRQDKRLKGIWWGAESGTHDDLVMSFAIMLQARSQQSCEMVADKTKISGFWLKEELDLAVAQGRVDKWAAKEYIDSHGFLGEDNTSNYKKVRVRSNV